MMNVIWDFVRANPTVVMALCLAAAAWVSGAHFSKAVAGAVQLAIAITGIVATVGVLTTVYQPALRAMAQHTGIDLPVADVGWAPIATITWSSPYTLLFLGLALLVNVAMFKWHRTRTIDIDIFDIWHLAFTGLLALYVGAPVVVVLLFIVLLVVLKLMNADLMKPTFNDLLGDTSSLMTTTHLNYMINPLVMVLDRIYSRCSGWLDRYDIDAAALNNRIGFAGSRFAIGMYIGIFVGLLGRLGVGPMLVLGFTLATTLELFNIIGGWFTAAVDPLTQALTDKLNAHFAGQPFNIGLDWAFLSSRAEVWATANILAPIMLLEALVLPGNRILPLGGIMAMGVTPALLVVTRGKVIRMVVIGAVELPLFLWAGSLSAGFVTHATNALAGSQHLMAISAATKEGPIEQFLAITLGRCHTGDWRWLVITVVAFTVYLLLFAWYAHAMRRRNRDYTES
ncbi:PTS transporter subunit IIC [Lacticaseibacillus thailandensis]|uniref:PTS family galactitol (Gat) porter component IIC n=1 Tax=Lacticaseibacillus thailandensis DSM 22698 = JCM 13996 TaxID=1423810 RepID=A0A0R2C8B0_9LACO|nr:PTS transporter subunit IIC [Lacticaseibacillus thailandensis]KRM87509.1 PTS family galactitol (gat) porter component IIC [Lacticaseibacillus thailandensis DSM 22698 = JCM 13996]